MAAGKMVFQKASGGVLNITATDGATSTDLVLPLSGTVAASSGVSTDKAIAIFNGTSGQLQNSSITVDTVGNIGTGAQSFNGFGGTGGFKNKFINSTKSVNTRGTTNTDNSYNYDMHYKVGNNWFRPIEGINIRSGKPHTISWEGSATCGYYIGTATSSTINAQTFTAIAKGETITPTITTGQNIWFKFASDSTGSTYLNEQFEEGSIATPFEFRHKQIEELLHFKYLPKHSGSAYGFTSNGSSGSVGIKFPVSARVAPTSVFFPSGLSVGNFSVTTTSVSSVCSTLSLNTGITSTGLDGLGLAFTVPGTPFGQNTIPGVPCIFYAGTNTILFGGCEL